MLRCYKCSCSFVAFFSKHPIWFKTSERTINHHKEWPQRVFVTTHRHHRRGKNLMNHNSHESSLVCTLGHIFTKVTLTIPIWFSSFSEITLTSNFYSCMKCHQSGNICANNFCYFITVFRKQYSMRIGMNIFFKA